MKGYLHNKFFYVIGLVKNSAKMPLSKKITNVVVKYFKNHHIASTEEKSESYGRPLCTISDETPDDIKYENDNNNSLRKLNDLKLLLSNFNKTLNKYDLGCFVFFDVWTKRTHKSATTDLLNPAEREKIKNGEEFVQTMKIHKVLCKVTKIGKRKTKVTLSGTPTVNFESTFCTVEVESINGDTNYLNITNVGIDCGPPFTFPKLFKPDDVKFFWEQSYKVQEKYESNKDLIKFENGIDQAWLTLLKSGYVTTNSSKSLTSIQNWVETNSMDIHRLLKKNVRNVSVKLWKYNTKAKNITWDYRNKKKLIYDEKILTWFTYPKPLEKYIPDNESTKVFWYSLNLADLNPILNPNAELYKKLPSILGTQAHYTVAYIILKHNQSILSVYDKISKFDQQKFDNNYTIAKSVGFIILDVIRKTLCDFNEKIFAVEFPTYDIRQKGSRNGKKTCYYSQIDAITQYKEDEFAIWEYKTIWVGRQSRTSDALKQAQYYSDVFFTMTGYRVKYIYILLLFVNENGVVKVNLQKYNLETQPVD